MCPSGMPPGAAAVAALHALEKKKKRREKSAEADARDTPRQDVRGVALAAALKAEVAKAAAQPEVREPHTALLGPDPPDVVEGTTSGKVYRSTSLCGLRLTSPLRKIAIFILESKVFDPPRLDGPPVWLPWPPHVGAARAGLT